MNNIYIKPKNKKLAEQLYKVLEEEDKEVAQLAQKVGALVEITWAELKALRDGGNLVAGRQYRITDYHCTTAQDNTQSADHQFDIIVTANSASSLNENARACLHSGDTYFSGNDANLGAWELKYSLDNDTDKFQWADSENGKGVIYWMKDEWNNECYYDFKNIMFKRFKIDTCSKSPDLEGLYGIDGGHDYTIDDETTYWCYTFCMIDNYDGESHDLSVEQKKYISDENAYYSTHNNKLSAYISNTYGEQTLDSFQLPNNVLVTDTDIACVEEDYSYGEFYGFYSNTFGNSCGSNTFGNNCGSNTFGNNCGSNTFGNGCNNNTFGNNFYYNTFGNSCGSNTFGNNFYYNTFGNSCGSNTFGNNFNNNTFGNNFNNNTFGNYCYSNTFGNDCYSNTFGNECYQNTFGNYMRWCSFEDGMQNVTTSCSTGSSAYLQNMHVLNGTQGASSSNKLTISITASRSYCTYVSKNSSGTLKIWSPADAV